MLTCAVGPRIGMLIHHQRMGGVVLNYVEQFPRLALEATVQPMTRSGQRAPLRMRTATVH
jgi:hypothetical protein